MMIPAIFVKYPSTCKPRCWQKLVNKLNKITPQFNSSIFMCPVLITVQTRTFELYNFYVCILIFRNLLGSRHSPFTTPVKRRRADTSHIFVSSETETRFNRQIQEETSSLRGAHQVCAQVLIFDL